MPNERKSSTPDPLDPVELDTEASEAFTTSGKPTGFTCPECHGGIFEMQMAQEEEGIPKFRCRVGHAFSGSSLLAEQRASVEAALWTALRALEESAALSRRLMSRATQRGSDRALEGFQRDAETYEERAKVIREVLRNGLPVAGDTELAASGLPVQQ